MTRTPAHTPGPPPALTAFLRGVERRGALFAELLAGSGAAGDLALRSALTGFGQVAGRTVFADWPRRFWSLLLAAPALRSAVDEPHWDPPFGVLGSIGPGPRAALLLRLVAGLGEADAAAVLGVAQPTYRLAVQRALPRLADGSPDLAVWEGLAQAARESLKTLPPERLAHVAVVREQALQGEAAATPGTRPSGRPSPGLALALAGVVVATAAALLATLWWPGGQGRSQATDAIGVEPLAAAEAPASRYAPEAAVSLHPDLGLLLDPPEPAAVDPGFFAWYAARSAEGAPRDAPLPAVVVPDAPGPGGETDMLESRDAPR